MSYSDRLSKLDIDPGQLTSAQRGVLNGLSDEEFHVLASMKRRLDTVEGDVQAHSEDHGGLIF
jgi:hypothetical protein